MRQRGCAGSSELLAGAYALSCKISKSGKFNAKHVQVNLYHTSSKKFYDEEIAC